MILEPGRVLSDRYRLVRPLGQGSQGAVWVADHLALNTHVAVKLIDPELAKREDALERFKREATAAAQLRSAHVVQIMDHGIADGQPFIVMELLDGEDLFERLNTRGRLSLRETSKIITQVCRALARAHAAGIVHRDLKPENVFLCNNEDDEVVKVLDFGVAKVMDPAKATMQRTGIGTLIGTPHYMSPEQVKGVSEIDARTDLWAIGVIAYQCVVGELPFDSEGVGDLLIKISIADPPVPSKVFPGAAAAFDTWFAKACERDPAKRFQTARELAEALARVVASVPEAMRGELPPRPASIRPPAVAAVPASGPRSAATPSPPVSAGRGASGTSRGLAPPPLPSRLAPTPQAVPVSVKVAQAPAPAVVEGDDAPTRARIPIPEDIDDFDFEFDEEPQVDISPVPVAAAAPAKPVAGGRQSTRPSTPGAAPAPVATPLPAGGPAPKARLSTPGQPTNALPVEAAVAATSLGAPVLPAGLLDMPSAPIAVAASPAPRAAAIAPVAAPEPAIRDRVSPPPELDGSRRRRTLFMVGFLFLAGIGGIVYWVIRSNMLPPGPTPAASVPQVQSPEMPPVIAMPDPVSSATTKTTKNIKPGPGTKKTTTKPGPSATTTATTKTTKKAPEEGTIEIPEAPAEDHSPEPPSPKPTPPPPSDDGTVPPAP